jgi:hypothetical protein
MTMRRASVVLALAVATSGCGPVQEQGAGGGAGSTGGDGAHDAGAGGSGGAGDRGQTIDFGPTFASTCNGRATTLTGTVLAPNGKDPVARARIYVPVAATPTPFPAGVTCELCDASVDAATVVAVSDAAGRFTLDLGSLSPTEKLTLTVAKGRFRHSASVGVTGCTATPVQPVATTLPGKSGMGDDIPKIAVATGNKDQLDAVLAAMGLDAKVGFDCFEGRATTGGTLSSPCGGRGTLAAIETLLADASALAKYNLLFLSCAPGKFKALPAATQKAVAANLAAWAEKGGRLFVTDNSYDYIAQAFPAAVTFLNGNTTVEAANVGYGTSSGAQYKGRVNDPTLAAWLTAVGALPAGSTSLTLGGYLNKWSVVQSLPLSTDDVVDALDAKAYASPSATTPGAATSYPQTLRFDVAPAGAANACGRAIYSSYHTLPTTAAPTAGELVPQERILEYLMLEAGACLGDIS